ncbi:MAG: hypothetical protein EOQ39_30195 [Mesorhizobium sp.]|nr:MAG: hypothetical protein EOQ37_35395 [Mesorhizobium sp.]RWB10855.1 MAG: hypothetical protein EOQ39_30195 [Mesorhizobium sp.]
MSGLPLSAVLRSRWRFRSSPLPRERMTTAVHDGMRFKAISSEARVEILHPTLFGLSSIPIPALLPLLVRDQLAGGPSFTASCWPASALAPLSRVSATAT